MGPTGAAMAKPRRRPCSRMGRSDIRSQGENEARRGGRLSDEAPAPSAYGRKLRRTGRHATLAGTDRHAGRCGLLAGFEPVTPLAVVPDHEDRGGVEDDE
jgi:hypothetical protein